MTKSIFRNKRFYIYLSITYLALCRAKKPSQIPIFLYTEQHQSILLYKNEVSIFLGIRTFQQLKTICKKLVTNPETDIKDILNDYNQTIQSEITVCLYGRLNKREKNK